MPEPRIDLEELVVHAFFALDRPGPQECYERVRTLWESWRPWFGHPVIGTDLPAELPAALPELPGATTAEVAVAGQESIGGDRQVVLRRQPDVLTVSIGFAGHTYGSDRSEDSRRTVASEPGWVDFDQEWEEMCRGVEGLLGESRLYLGTAPDLPRLGPAEAIARVAEGRLPAGAQQPFWWRSGITAAGGLGVWEITPHVEARVQRRILVLGPPANSAGLSAWTWSAGGVEMPPFGRYLLHAAHLRRLVRDAEFSAGLSARVRETVSRLRANGTGLEAQRKLAELRFDVATARHELVGHLSDAEIIRSNMERALVPDPAGGRRRGLFEDDRDLARWLAQHLGDEIAQLDADRVLLRTGDLPDEDRRTDGTRGSRPTASRPEPRPEGEAGSGGTVRGGPAVPAAPSSPAGSASPAALSSPSADGLDEYFDHAVARALRAWAASVAGEVVLPARRWRWDGPYTGAVLAPIILKEPNAVGTSAGRALIVKVCPPDARYVGEAARARAAALRSPRFAEEHLVRQPFVSYPVRDGRSLMFQEIAGSPRHTVTLGKVRPRQLASACRAAVDLVLTGWNDVANPQLYQATAAEYLRTELRGALEDRSVRAWASGAGALEDGADSITVDDSGVDLPNPIRMADPASPLGRTLLDYLAGFSHGDLHPGNVMVTQRAGGKTTTKFIDLSAYEEKAPLTRDVVTLLLSQVEAVVSTPLAEEEATELLELVLDPENVEPLRIGSGVVGPVKAVYDVIDLVPVGFHLDWRLQYLLSVQAQSLVHLSYDDVGPGGRWWFFRLAARAAARFHEEVKEDGFVPPRGVEARPVRPPGSADHR